MAADIQKVDYLKKKHCFQIVTPERIYHIRCDREDDLVDWVNAIRKQQSELLYPSQKAAPSAAPAAVTPVSAAAPVVAPTVSAPAAQPALGAGQATPTQAPPTPNHDVRVFVYATGAEPVGSTLLEPFATYSGPPRYILTFFCLLNIYTFFLHCYWAACHLSLLVFAAENWRALVFGSGPVRRGEACWSNRRRL